MAMRFRVTNAGRRVSLLLLFASAASQRAIAQVSPDALFASASPAVVKLSIKDEDDREIGTGSGFVVAFEEKVTGAARHFESTIITNYHVIYPAVNIGVLFPDQGTGKASGVVDEDPSADVAVLTVRSSGSPKQVLKLCDGEAPAIGTKVFTIGSPLGFTNTLSEGLISGYRQRDGGSRWMQISAPISPGSSGGPVLSVDGCVLGVTTATAIEGQNLNFAVPAKDVVQLLNAPNQPREVWEGASKAKAEGSALCEAVAKMQERCLPPAAVESAREIAMVGWGKALERLDECRLAGVREGDQLSLLLTGCNLQHQKQYDDAVAMLRRAADAKTGEFAYLAHYELGVAVWMVNWNSGKGDAISLQRAAGEQAIPSWIKAKELRADFAPTRYRLGKAYRDLKLHADALLEAEAVVRLLPRYYDGYVQRGTAWAGLGRREEFERDFEQAILLHPDDAHVYFQKGFSYATVLKDPESAMEAHLQSIRIDGDDRSAHRSLVYLYIQLGHCEKAMEYLGKLTRLIEAGASDASDARTLEDAGRSIQKCREGVKLPPWVGG